MNHSTYPHGATAVLLIDPYNDFLSEGGKLHGHARDLIDTLGTVKNMRTVVESAREAGIPIVYVPHHRALPGDFAGWRNLSPYALAGHEAQVFAVDSWGGEWHPDFQPHPGDLMAREHWSASGFANTDLDLQLTQRGISHVILVGLLANTCLETTGRFASELGYHVTLVRDATAAFSKEALHSAHEINGPTYAHAILTSDEVRRALVST